MPLIYTPYAVTCFATFILATLLAAGVLWKSPKSAPSRYWALMCLLVAGWSIVNTRSLLGATLEDSIRYLRIADAFALFIPVVFLHFSMHFSGRMRPRLLKAAYLATFLVATTVGTPWFVRSGQQKFGIWFEQGGPAFVAFAALFVLLPACGLRLLWQEARTSEGTRRAQLLCLLIACAIGFAGETVPGTKGTRNGVTDGTQTQDLESRWDSQRSPPPPEPPPSH